MTAPNLLPEFTELNTKPMVQLEDSQLPVDATPEITDAEVAEASQATGMVVIDTKKIKGFAKIGKYLKRAGLVEVARGKLASRQDALERSRKVLLELVEDKVTPIALDPEEKPMVYHELILAAANGLVAVVKAENEIDELNLKLEKVAAINAPNSQPMNPLPPIDVGFVPIQPKSLPDKEEEPTIS